MTLISADEHERLLANGRKVQSDPDCTLSLYPVVKLNNPQGLGTWLLTHLDPANSDIAHGIVDLGYPDFGNVSLSELEAVIWPFDGRVERDPYWVSAKPIFAYMADAQAFRDAHMRRAFQKANETPPA